MEVGFEHRVVAIIWSIWSNNKTFRFCMQRNAECTSVDMVIFQRHIVQCKYLRNINLFLKYFMVKHLGILSLLF